MPAHASTSTKTTGILIPRDLLDAMESYARKEPGLTAPEAVRSALREWAIERGLMPAQPTECIPVDDLNASNDV